MNITFESILSLLTNCITEVRTTVGSFSYNILSAVTFRLLDIETRLYSQKLNQNVNTADDQAMDDLANNRGITRKPATTGVGKGKFNIEIPEGARFQINETIWVRNDFLESIEGYYYYKMISEQTGASVNKNIGQLIPITFIEGLNYAYLEEILIPAEDEETTEELKKRYKDSWNAKSFAGNKISYIEKINEIDGVGGTKVYPLKYGNGTVGITIINTLWSVPSSELISIVQNIIDPDKDGEGEGSAPIGAIVTIKGVENQNIKIGIKCQFKSGDFNDWKNDIEDIIKNYFTDKNKIWANSSETVIRIAEIIVKVIEHEMVVDVLELTINDADSNLVLDEDKIAYLSELEEIA